MRSPRRQISTPCRSKRLDRFKLPCRAFIPALCIALLAHPGPAFGARVNLTLDENQCQGFIRAQLGANGEFWGLFSTSFTGQLTIEIDDALSTLAVTDLSVQATNPGIEVPPIWRVLVDVPPGSMLSVEFVDLALGLDPANPSPGIAINPLDVDYAAANLLPSGVARYFTEGFACSRLESVGGVCQLNAPLNSPPATPSIPRSFSITDGFVTQTNSTLTLAGACRAAFPLDPARPGAGSGIVQFNLHAVGSRAPTCPSDFNSDSITSVADIFDFLSAWFDQFGSCASSCTADIDRSGAVNVADIFAYLGYWFAGFNQPCT